MKLLFPAQLALSHLLINVVNKLLGLHFSQLLKPSLNGDELAINFRRCGLESCKNNLHGRLIFAKGDFAKHVETCWFIECNLVGKGFYKFFSSDDM